jgi:murein L,D-transpeptidase YcbB/YkuD
MISRPIALLALVLAPAFLPPVSGIAATSGSIQAATGTAVSDSLVPLRLVLNVAASRLDLLEEGKATRSYRVAVGTCDHPTPIGSFRIDRIVWNPWWVPPPFDWARDMKVTPPGPDNPTGRVKLFFGYYLFIHGTSAEESLGGPASHGCVRLSNADAIELARTAHTYGSPGVDAAVLDSLESDPGMTRTIRLTQPVPLAVRYDRIEVRDGRLLLHPDPYGMDPIGRGDVLSALATAGVPATDVAPFVVDAALERAAGGSVSIDLRDLRGPVGP